MSLVMVVAGIIGMVSYMVNIRRYDMGVKLAIGANNKLMLKNQLSELLLPLCTALFFAFSVVYFSLGYSKTVPSWVFPIQWDVIVYSLIILALLSIFACVIPIYKVLQGNPIKALRNE